MGSIFAKSFELTKTNSDDYDVWDTIEFDGYVFVQRLSQTDDSQTRDLELSQEETTRPLRSNHEDIPEADVHSKRGSNGGMKTEGSEIDGCIHREGGRNDTETGMVTHK